MNIQNCNFPETPANRPHPKSPLFDHERLEVYKLQLDFIKWVTPLIEEAMRCANGRPREVCDQLDRASISAVLNTAEGNGKRQRQIRAKFFDDARGSATECAGCLDAVVAKGIVAAERVLDGKALLVRVVSILCKLIDRFDEASDRFHEDPVVYRIRQADRLQSRTRRERGRGRGRKRGR